MSEGSPSPPVETAQPEEQLDQPTEPQQPVEEQPQTEHEPEIPAESHEEPTASPDQPQRKVSGADKQPASLYWISRDRLQDQNARDPADMKPDSPEWMGQELHLFIVTDAGKPVYSRYGTVQKLSPILCTCVAILGHMDSLKEELNHFRAGSHTFVFLPKKPFVFIAVSKSSLPVSYLFKQLNFLYNLFLSLFSESLINQLSMRPSCDFRQIAEGTRPAWDGVVNNMSEDPAFIFAPSIPISHCRPELRAEMTQGFKNLPSCKLSMLMYRNRVIALETCTCDSLSLRLIVDLMWTPAFQSSGETWTPFFARDSTDGMHHLYINKHKDSDFCLVMLCTDSQSLVDYHGRAVSIFRSIESHRESLEEKLEKYNGTDGKHCPPEFYFWALHSIQYGQVYITEPREEHFGGPDGREKMQELVRQLAKSCDMVETNKVEGEYMFKGEKEVIVVYKSAQYEIYAVANSNPANGPVLEDSQISTKMADLKAFINANLNRLIITEHKFQVEPFN